VLVRENTFDNVQLEVVDEEAIRKAAEARLKQFMGRQEPVAVWSFESLVGNSFVDGSGNSFGARIHGGASQVDDGLRGKAVRFDGTGCLRVEEPAVFNAPDVTISLWAKPEVLSGRRGLIAKRFRGTIAPFVVSHQGANLRFEATEEGGPWTFNFGSAAIARENEWIHVAAVAKQGAGVTLYADGKVIAKIDNTGLRAHNDEPVILGREAWGGDPPKADRPGFFVGLMDEVKIWTRALSEEEIQREFASGKGSK
jgi:hypothetical protein